jgi:hypothetical protein
MDESRITTDQGRKMAFRGVPGRKWKGGQFIQFVEESPLVPGIQVEWRLTLKRALIRVNPCPSIVGLLKPW